jgi:hypothetical protein
MIVSPRPTHPPIGIEEINKKIHHTFLSGMVNEKWLCQCLSKIEFIEDTSHPAYWLLVARLNEAALLCAGNYADNAEFTLAGDLLLNPRQTVVHIKGKLTSELKNRHGRISDQFKLPGDSQREFMKWFSQNAVIEQTQPPILPYLINKLESSEYISKAYIDACHMRMCKIADTINFLMAWGIQNFEDLVHKKAANNFQTIEFIENNICCFDTDWFIRIGEAIKRYLQTKEQLAVAAISFENTHGTVGCLTASF